MIRSGPTQVTIDNGDGSYSHVFTGLDVTFSFAYQDCRCTSALELDGGIIETTGRVIDDAPLAELPERAQ